MELTKKIKTKWLKALKSGTYKQGFTQLYDNFQGKDAYCCLGVLCKVMDIPISEDGMDCFPKNGKKGYPFFFDLLGKKETEYLWVCNDRDVDSTDYSNVIPLIKKLPTVD